MMMMMIVPYRATQVALMTRIVDKPRSTTLTGELRGELSHLMIWGTSRHSILRSHLNEPFFGTLNTSQSCCSCSCFIVDKAKKSTKLIEVNMFVDAFFKGVCMCLY